eukprot:TRINITY_DN4099_c0_g1_i2.p1 TRINITY_DN4099_c0_g1~~TRINITY_DN4099_c0_g1_i2.p1  ORF type:complete len:236 (+),score=23.56 TRINITY_DN4099_c0_g1_i2:57-764(+)
MGQASSDAAPASSRTATEALSHDQTRATYEEQLEALKAVRRAQSLHEDYRVHQRPGRPEDCDDRGRVNYGRHGKFLLPESLLPNDYYANSLRNDRQLTNGPPQSQYIKILPGQPHHSDLTYEVDLRLPSTGVNPYEGERPWRCGDRLLDWVFGFISLRYVDPTLILRCGLSEIGEEPRNPYTTLSRHDVEYFVDRRQRGNMRKYAIEPTDNLDPRIARKDMYKKDGPLPELPPVT